MRKLLGWVDSAATMDRGSSVVAPLLATAFSLLMIPAWIVTLSGAEHRTASMFLGISYGVACVLAVPLASRQSWTVQGVVCMIVLAMGLTLVGLTGPENSAILVCALGIVAALMPVFVTVAVTIVTVSGLLVTAAYTGELAGQFQNMVILVSVTAAAVLTVGLANAYTELKAARDQIAMFAVAKERERFARDLHDILGHSLTTLTLKAGLARRVLETGDVDRCITEIRDLERLGRQALTDVRATVSEYREVTLTGELAAASETLRAADIKADLPYAVDNVDPKLQQVFGYVLREAITNVVRHSEATKVGVRLERASIEITNNGPVPASKHAAGNGLAGLAERVRAHQGTVEAGPRTGGGWVVRASAPLESEVRADSAELSPQEDK